MALVLILFMRLLPTYYLFTGMGTVISRLPLRIPRGWCSAVSELRSITLLEDISHLQVAERGVGVDCQ
jgi:hypothetical protein